MSGIYQDERDIELDVNIIMNFTIDKSNAGERLDAAVLKYVEDTSRSQVKRWIDAGSVTVNGEVKKTSYKVKDGEVIYVTPDPPVELSARPQDIPIDILYEDLDIVVLNKAAGMVVHPAAGNPDGTLVNALLYHCKDLSGIGGVLRPGIVHRLDKGTSGVIVVAKNDKAHLNLSEQFKDRKTKKIYKAIIYGSPKLETGTFDMEIGRHPTDRKKMSTKSRQSRDAVTHWKVVKRFAKEFTLVEVRLITGRTHQIRVHFAAVGMPILGDDLYGGKRTIKRLRNEKMEDVAKLATRPMLHAESIEFTHPKSGKKLLFNTALPEDIQVVLRGLDAASS